VTAEPQRASSEAARSPAGEAQSSALRPDGKRVAIHTLDVRGRFIRARRITFALLMGIYVAAPLVRVGGHPAVHLDVDARRFYLLGGTFNAQDFWIVLFVCTALLFTLLFLTAWHGRVWCGWACPQTVFLEGLYRPIERLCDGPRSRRLKLADETWTFTRIARTTAKHTLYLAVSLAISHVALSLFLSASDLVAMVREGPARHPAAFTWSVAVTGALYFNFAWFREQLCIVLCPYGRLQSVLHDRDSIVIGYDAVRGEPRGKLARETAAPGRTGDCVDCKKCIYACPTGIDIRNGLQMECLACAQCADVCDEVMVKIGRAPGLIRYASLNQLDGRPRRILRPRLYLYAAVAGIALAALAATVVGRSSFELTLVRQPGIPWIVDGTRVRNQLDVHVTNKSAERERLVLSVDRPVPADVRLGDTVLDLPSLGDVRVPLVISVDGCTVRPDLAFTVALARADGETRRQTVRFLAPPPGKCPPPDPLR
jgi:cytochrome c oxidase accessory protein FixG